MGMNRAMAATPEGLNLAILSFISAESSNFPCFKILNEKAKRLF
jgi:hypothetical protein